MPIVSISGSSVSLPFPPPNTYYVGPGIPTKGNGTNRISLTPGQMFMVPAGPFLVQPGPYTYLEIKDPITGQWFGKPGSLHGGYVYVESDGQNHRLMNYTGMVMGAVVTDGGSGYVSGNVTVTASAGGSTWNAIVGGALTVSSVTSGGSGYGLPPLVIIDAPPVGGIPATAYATISAGAVTAVTLINAGAGYTSVPNVYIVPDPNDPNLGVSTITGATVSLALTGAGTITGVYPVSNGSTPVTSAPTLTISSTTGSNATASPIMCFSVTGVTVGTAGVAVPGTAVSIVSAGGSQTATAVSTAANPSYTLLKSCIRNVDIYAPVSGGAVGTPVIIDSGLFQVAPTPLVLQESGTAATTAPAVTFALGGVEDTSMFQSV